MLKVKAARMIAYQGTHPHLWCWKPCRGLPWARWGRLWLQGQVRRRYSRCLNDRIDLGGLCCPVQRRAEGITVAPEAWDIKVAVTSDNRNRLIAI